MPATHHSKNFPCPPVLTPLLLPGAQPPPPPPLTPLLLPSAQGPPPPPPPGGVKHTSGSGKASCTEARHTSGLSQISCTNGPPQFHGAPFLTQCLSVLHSPLALSSFVTPRDSQRGGAHARKRGAVFGSGGQCSLAFPPALASRNTSSCRSAVCRAVCPCVDCRSSFDCCFLLNMRQKWRLDEYQKQRLLGFARQSGSTPAAVLGDPPAVVHRHLLPAPLPLVPI